MPLLERIWLKGYENYLKKTFCSNFEAINLYPEDLQDVYCLLAKMSVTHVNVERLFSAFKTALK